MRVRSRLISGTVLLPLVAMSACATVAPEAPAVALDGVPVFEGDPDWPTLPPHWIIGPGTGIFVDARDHVWVLHRPERLSEEQIAEAQNRGVPGCCVPAPPLIEIDPEGNVVQAWGSVEPAPDWPEMPHGVFVDHDDHVWVATSIFHQVMKFTRDGRHLMTIGEYGQAAQFDDTHLLAGSADIYVDPERNELYVADGYNNRRIIVFDAETGEYRRHWGAYGERVDVAPAGGGRAAAADGASALPRTFNLPHGVAGSGDGLIYVADRGNSRIQVFTRDGEFVREQRVREGGTGAFDLAFSHDPAQSFVYVADGQQHKIWTLDRQTLEVLREFGGPGTGPGEFGRPHNLASDARGNLYVAEADPGFRWQKLVFRGTTPR